MEPKDRVAQARIDAGMTSKELAEKLGVDKATMSNWESGRRPLTLERLLQVAQVLGVGITYLLGLDGPVPGAPVSKNMLPALHRAPVWTKSYGWALVNSQKQQLVFADGGTMPFDAIQEPVFTIPPAFSVSLRGAGAPLGIDEVSSHKRIWLEPITLDPDLAVELRGWYRPQGHRLVENEYGNRFYMDAYGSKWLAFERCFE